MSRVQSGQAAQRSNGKAKPRSQMAKGKRSRAAAEDAPRIAHGTRKLEERWRAESDMRILAETAKILEQPQRVAAAKKVAQEQARAAQEAAQAVMGVRTTKGGDYDGDE